MAWAAGLHFSVAQGEAAQQALLLVSSAVRAAPGCVACAARTADPPAPPGRLQAPALGVIALGAVMAVRLAWGLMTFRSKPEEAAALHKASAAPCQRGPAGVGATACAAAAGQGRGAPPGGRGQLWPVPGLAHAGGVPAAKGLPLLLLQDISRARELLASKGYKFEEWR